MKRRPGRRVREFVAEQRPEWQDDAACVGADPKLFYPPQGNHTLDATPICGLCSVRAECLEYALSFGSSNQFGMWGGRSANYRRRLLQRRAREGSNS